MRPVFFLQCNKRVADLNALLKTCDFMKALGRSVGSFQEVLIAETLG